MEEKKDILISRKSFFKLAAVFTGSIFVAASGIPIDNLLKNKNTEFNKTIRLNPAFRIKNISTNKIELFCYLPNGTLLSHHFSEFEADIFRQIEDGNNFSSLNFNLAKAYHLPESKCKEKLIKSLKELKKGNLIYSGDKMKVKISEIRFGN